MAAELSPTVETTETALKTTMAELPLQAKRKLGPTSWQTMTQEQVNQFADLTDDHNFIHVDPERARQTPFRGTVAHGFLTLAMLGPISQQLVRVEDAKLSINYGLNKARFPAALPVGAAYRGHGEVLEVSEIDRGVQLTASFTIEVQGVAKPALVAECVLRYYR